MSDRANLMHRRAMFASAAAATLLAATGVQAAVPRRGGRLRLAVSGARRDDTWLRGGGLFMQLARQGLVFETLTQIAADGTLRPDLATGWDVAPNGRDWTFTLRQDVRFHDGGAMTPRDVAKSLAATLPQAKVTARGDIEVHIALDAPDAGLPLQLAGPLHVIRPAHAPGAGIGTGLYRVRRFAPGQQLLCTRVASHRNDGTAGWFDEVELVSVPDETARVQALAGYMVHGCDADGAARPADAVALPDRLLVSRDLGLPARIGTTRPFDDLRAPQRWWLA